MGGPSPDIAAFSIGTLPFLLIFGTFAIMGGLFFFSRLTANDYTEIAIAMGTIWLIVIAVLIFVSRMCFTISPVENFASGSDSDSDSSLDPEIMVSILDAEKAVCKMMDSVKGFIESDLGQKGQDDPSLVTQAFEEAEAEAEVAGPLTVCPPDDNDSSDVQDRLARMELTLDQFVEPHLKRTFETATKSQCTEGFFVESVGLDNDEEEKKNKAKDKENKDKAKEIEKIKSRLQAIQTTLHRLTVRYLNPIQQRQDDIRSGKVSDCDKKKGATAAVDASIGSS